MLTGVYGLPGAGKGCLLTKFAYDLYVNEGRDILRNSCSLIDELNLTRNKKLSYPEKVPIFSDFKISFPVNYKKKYETYFINGFYFGVKNSKLRTLLVPPGSRIFLSEVQRYYDSRKSSSLPSFVSNLYEMHRHWNLDIWLDLQRFSLLDLNIRDIVARFILVEDLQVIKNPLGDIIELIWKCKEFTSAKDVDLYMDKGASTFKDVVFNHKGNIFDYYDSFNNKDKFSPNEGEDFKFLNHDGYVPLSDKAFYDFNMPKGYRTNNG